jgi:hypothetical protein
MTQTISRIYANKADADAAVEDLKEHGFAPDEIFMVSAPEARESASATGNESVVEEIADRIVLGYIHRRHAAEYAKKVAEGCVLVTVYAPFGAAFKATVILDRHHPIDSGVPLTVYPRATWDEAAPLSSGLRLPVLSSDPTPFASFWNVPSLWSLSAPLSDWLGYGTNLNSPAPLSTLFNLPVVTEKGATISSSLGLPLLW